MVQSARLNQLGRPARKKFNPLFFATIKVEMEDDILSEVIEVEKELQRCLELERGKARERLEKIRIEAEQELASSEQEIQKSLRTSYEKTLEEARSKAASMVHDAEAKADQLAKLEDGRLINSIMKQLNGILPG